MDKLNSAGDGQDEARGHQGADAPRSPAGAEPELTAGAWLIRNGVTLALLVVVFIWLYNYFGADGMVSIAKAAIGIGFVIFIHELGHFAVAKWCDVHVETFSIGFGPAIPGCSFQRGETYYKIAWFPLGGYVKMVGEGAEEDDEHDDDPRSFKNKPVWQRMAIISAGVTMNILSAGLFFVIVYMTHGAEMLAGSIGAIDCGSPAWQQGIPSGARIVQINNIRDPYFDDVMPEIMHTRKGNRVTFVYEPPGQPGTRVTKYLEPRLDKEDPKPVIGIMKPDDLLFVDRKDRGWPAPYLQESAAAQSSPPLDFGDKIVATTDPDHPEQLKPIDNDFPEFYRRLRLLADRPLVLRVERKGEGSDPLFTHITVPVAHHYVFGMRMRMGHIIAVREGSPAAEAGIQPRELEREIEGDIIKEVEVAEADGSKTRFVTSRPYGPAPAGVTIKDLDPERLPFELDRWAARQKESREVVLTVLRPVEHAARQTVTLRAKWDDTWRFDRELPINATSPLSVAGLGLAYRIETFVDAVEPSGPAQSAGIREGDMIKAVRFREPGSKAGESAPARWVDLDYDLWAHVLWTLQLVDFKEVTLRVERDKEIQELTLKARADDTWPEAERGFYLMPAIRILKADTPLQAIALGMHRTLNTIKQIYQNLLAMVTRRISLKNIGGPIMIGKMAYQIAGDSFFTFLTFLGMISINLAVFNFLPIPILDGGHMVFLVYEMVRGKAASEKVRLAATYAGLLLILSLMAFVIFLDVSRYF